MEWIDVCKELPKTKKRYLAICSNGNEWTGIVDVYFDPHLGWRRCESHDTKEVYVTHYAAHPFFGSSFKKEE